MHINDPRFFKVRFLRFPFMTVLTWLAFRSGPVLCL